MDNLARAAQDRHRLQWAHHLYLQAIGLGDASALVSLAEMHKKAGDHGGAETLLQQAADHGDANALFRLAEMREEAGDRNGAETLHQQAADHGYPSPVLKLSGLWKVFMRLWRRTAWTRTVRRRLNGIDPRATGQDETHSGAVDRILRVR
ncbi:hypothetical protein ACWF2L_06600 [Streptomyces anulatus]